MYGRKVKLRFLFVVIILITLILTTFLILKSLEENVVYFQSPSEIKSLSEIDKGKIRVGGMVKKDSISISSNEVNFIITDFKNEINVTYSGAVPNLFAEGKGVVAELACSVVSDPNLETNLFCSLTNCILVTKYKPRKLNKVKLKADNTYNAYPFIKSNSFIIIYLNLCF